MVEKRKKKRTKGVVELFHVVYSFAFFFFCFFLLLGYCFSQLTRYNGLYSDPLNIVNEIYAILLIRILNVEGVLCVVFEAMCNDDVQQVLQVALKKLRCRLLEI